MNRFLILDTETTGLDPRIHRPWEVAAQLIQVDWGKRTTQTLSSYVAFIRLDFEALQLADPAALNIGRFSRYDSENVWTPGAVSAHLLAMCAGLDPVYLVGACPWFDDDMLKRWVFHPTHTVAPWHYHLQDVEALGNGVIASDGGWPIAKSRELGEFLHVEPQTAEEHHTAWGDVAWARRMFEAIWGLKPLDANGDAR